MKGIIGTIHGAWAGTKIILLGILPRGTDYWDGGSGETAWPNVLTPAINSVNTALKVGRDMYTVFTNALCVSTCCFKDGQGSHFCHTCGSRSPIPTGGGRWAIPVGIAAVCLPIVQAAVAAAG